MPILMQCESALSIADSHWHWSIRGCRHMLGPQTKAKLPFLSVLPGQIHGSNCRIQISNLSYSPRRDHLLCSIEYEAELNNSLIIVCDIHYVE